MIMNMRLLSFAAAFQALAVLLVAVTQVQAGPLSIQKRKNLDVWIPQITAPTASSVWDAGAVELVSWDTSNAPQNISNGGHVVLKSAATTFSQSQFKHLAGPFDLRIGQINVTLPDGLVTGEYTIVLFGDSGNESDQFHINGAPYSLDGQQIPNADSNPFGDSGPQTPTDSAAPVASSASGSTGNTDFASFWKKFGF
ncbi:hypothetical protein P691DRAFT_702940 [Macrolepiota fuliginosa MF-IS2]|uniref:Uncharacterized protein n=1 Tax=Macrolepiota fuliginosa MF-IS2 TaxID=1400762 RepID=A0A9P6C5V2_9AGAR|nr:hypothetical protein P691DRAFT_702940 [Macrolepiota fuliginosa MF-IS2]